MYFPDPNVITPIVGNPYMGVSKNRGTFKSSILIGFPIINHPFWGTPIFGNIHISPFFSCVCMGEKNPQESLENTINTMTLLGVHPNNP